MVKLRLREIRKSKKMTQTDVAYKAMISLTAYQNYERGERSPTIDTLVSISEALDCNFFELVDFKTQVTHIGEE